MKAPHLWALLLLYLGTGQATAQLNVGSSGLVVKAGGHLHVAGLELRPTADLELNNLDLSLSTSPINSATGNSIARVYRFSAPFPFTGLARIYYQANELNGNQPAALTLTYQSNAAGPFMNATQGTLSNANTVENWFNATPIYTLTSIDQNTVLPLKLLRFSASAQATSTRLEWTTTEERDLWGYRIMRAADGQAFSLLANVPAKLAGLGVQTYVLQDPKPWYGTNYYQLLEVDPQGNTHQLGLAAVNFGLNEMGLMVYPNPGTGPFTLYTGHYTGRTLHVQLFDMQGKLISKSALHLDPGTRDHPLNLPTHLARGMYQLKIADAQGQHSFKLVVK